MSLNNKCEPYLVNDRIFKIKDEIKSIKNKITLCEDIISKFKLIPLSMQSGINKNIRGNKDFISIYEEDISRYKNQLQNLYISLEELKKLL